MVRHFQPRVDRSKWGVVSLLWFWDKLLKRTKPQALICIEPFPRKFLREGFPGLRSLIEKKVQDIDLEFFLQLESGDILFIDSSHTVKIGSDVNYLFLEVLPRLRPGVIVHVHDIFLPFRVPTRLGARRISLLDRAIPATGLSTFNSEFEVLMANSYLNHYHQQELKAAFPDLIVLGGRQLLDAAKAPIAALRPSQMENGTASPQKH